MITNKRIYLTRHTVGLCSYVAWIDNVTPPPTDKAKRLQELAQLIISRVNVNPEVQRLPVPRAAYA